MVPMAAAATNLQASPTDLQLHQQTANLSQPLLPQPTAQHSIKLWLPLLPLLLLLRRLRPLLFCMQVPDTLHRDWTTRLPHIPPATGRTVHLAAAATLHASPTALQLP
jgi:hypothetical protein